MKFFKNLRTREYIMIVVLFFVLMVGGIVGGYYLMNESKGDVSEKLAVLGHYTAQEKKVTDFLAQYEDVKRQSLLLNTSVPSRESLVDFVEHIEMIGNSLGLATTVSFDQGVVTEEGVDVSIVPDSAKKITKYTGISNVESLEVGVAVSGDYSSFIDFLNLLGQIKYYNTVTSVKVITGTSVDTESLAGVGAYETDYVLTLNLYVKSGNNNEVSL